ncbi:MAG: nuclear transport factor 2 family protein [Neisseriales bacterium]|nr:MAG: nuclear transport factor 2 family protein [Neisseriales bacterium]
MGAMTIIDIATSFSTGKFNLIYDFITPEAEWEIVGESLFSGREQIIANCERVRSYFNTVMTNFKIANILVDGDKVVINGTAEFFKNDQLVSFISACDLYQFNEQKQLIKITSYCIAKSYSGG